MDWNGAKGKGKGKGSGGRGCKGNNGRRVTLRAGEMRSVRVRVCLLCVVVVVPFLLFSLSLSLLSFCCSFLGPFRWWSVAPPLHSTRAHHYSDSGVPPRTNQTKHNTT